MSKVVIHPKNISKLEEIHLKHPKDHSDCVYFLDVENKQLFELSSKKNEFYSWLTSTQLFHDGNLYSFTQIDPLFVLTPLLCDRSDKFQNLSDILMEHKLPFEMQTLFSENIVKCIAETKAFEEDVFVKYNEERCLRWLEAKFEKLKAGMKAMGFGKKLLGYQLSNCSALDATFTEDEVKVFAFELLSDYLSPKITDKLRIKLSIVDTAELLATPMGDKSNKSKSQLFNNSAQKRSLEEEIGKEYSNEKKDPAPKKPKMTRTERQLSKVDKTGMKSIASYFGKKA